MRTIVTGANGFVGTHLCDKLKGLRDTQVTAVTHSSLIGDWQHKALHGTKLARADVRDTHEMRRLLVSEEIDVAFHLAALAIVKHAHKDPLNTFDVNLMGTVSVLEACRQADTERVVVMCTDKVYGDGRDMVETHPYSKGQEPYGASKTCQAIAVNSYAQTYGMKISMLHSCNIFGYDPYSNRIVPNVVKTCLRGKNPIIFTNDSSEREYVYVSDVLAALERLGTQPQTGAFNLGTGMVYNQEQIVEMILGHFPNLQPMFKTHTLPKQLEYQSIDSIHWDFNCMVGMEEGIGRTIEAFKRYRGDWD